MNSSIAEASLIGCLLAGNWTPLEASLIVPWPSLPWSAAFVTAGTLLSPITSQPELASTSPGPPWHKFALTLVSGDRVDPRFLSTKNLRLKGAWRRRGANYVGHSVASGSQVRERER